LIQQKLIQIFHNPGVSRPQYRQGIEGLRLDRWILELGKDLPELIRRGTAARNPESPGRVYSEKNKFLILSEKPRVLQNKIQGKFVKLPNEFRRPSIGGGVPQNVVLAAKICPDEVPFIGKQNRFLCKGCVI